MGILNEIVAHKKIEVAELKKSFGNLDLSNSPKRNSFKKALLSQKPAVIAEIKQKSPSAGLLYKSFDPISLAKQFEKNGASALSVLTDEKFFGGSFEILKKVSQNTTLPLLCKEFVIDSYQIDLAKLKGASAILLIAAILSPQEVKTFYDHAQSLGLDVIVEVHNEKEYQSIKDFNFEIIGINNRNLDTLKTDLKTSFDLAPRINPGSLIVCESGIKTKNDYPPQSQALLIGESFAKNPGLLLELKG
jgi:indole-3-glycerol phosphate synthase